jgi:hypothetical protein
MSLLDGLLGNKTLMNAALGKLGDVMRRENLEYVIVSLDPEDGGILLKMAKPGDVTIIENVSKQEPTENGPAIISVTSNPEKSDTNGNS